MMNKVIENTRKALETRKDRSAWNKGVNLYSLDLLDELEEAIGGGYFDIADLAAPLVLKKALLNGADDWEMYSWGGSSLIYDSDIAERLCNPTELKRTDHGRLNPNSREQWLDTQARALFQAANRLTRTIKEGLC